MFGRMRSLSHDRKASRWRIKHTHMDDMGLSWALICILLMAEGARVEDHHRDVCGVAATANNDSRLSLDARRRDVAFSTICTQFDGEDPVSCESSKLRRRFLKKSRKPGRLDSSILPNNLRYASLSKCLFGARSEPSRLNDGFWRRQFSGRTDRRPRQDVGNLARPRYGCLFRDRKRDRSRDLCLPKGRPTS